jgi:hypothetical protein
MSIEIIPHIKSRPQRGRIILHTISFKGQIKAKLYLKSPMFFACVFSPFKKKLYLSGYF